MSALRIACGSDAPIWDVQTDGPSVPGAYYCCVCDTPRAYVITSHDLTSQVAYSKFFYGHCSLCGHSVFLGEIISKWLPGPELADVLAAEIVA